MKLQTLDLNSSEKPAKRSGFLHRQHASASTPGQLKFDWIFGVGLPMVCIAADPGVFRTWYGDQGLLSDHLVFCYLLSSVSIMAMAAWLLWGNGLGAIRPFLGGLFLAAAAASTVVGIILFPFSLIGSIFVIGLLGFTPLVSGFVFFPNASRVLAAASDDDSTGYVLQAATLAFIYALAVPYVLNF